MKASTIILGALMDPWKIIGWGVLLVIACFAVAFVAAFLAGFLIARAKRKIALNTPPAAGQNWDQDGRWLQICDVRDGRVHVRTTNASWSESIEEWKGRVRNRHLTLKEAA